MDSNTVSSTSPDLASGEWDAWLGWGSGRGGWHQVVISSPPLPTSGAEAAPSPGPGVLWPLTVCALIQPAPFRGKWSCPLSFCLHAEVGAVFLRDGPLFSCCFVFKDWGSSMGPSPSFLIPSPCWRGPCVINFLHFLHAFSTGGLLRVLWAMALAEGAPLPLCREDSSSLVSGRGRAECRYLSCNGIELVNKSCTCWPAVFIVETLLAHVLSIVCIL